MAASLLDPGPTLLRAEELRQQRGTRGLLEAVGTPLSYAPNPVVSAIGQGLLGARYLTGERPPEEGLLNLSNMTAMMIGSQVPAPLRNIISPAVARTLGYKSNLPADETFGRAVQNTPGAQVVEDGLLMRVTRGQRPEQGLTPSVRGGVFYLPEGSANMKHYSTGKTGYGGSERIAGETLVQNPVFVKGGTGGKAPQMAYDQLMGKGAYDKMRDEALKSTGSWNASPQQQAQMADEFLDVYAPEMSGMGEYIVKNSKQGNQLPYALQEAAVASAVRKAGHDSVLGYSVSRKGGQEFLSELFDVRESAYPDKFGGYRTW